MKLIHWLVNTIPGNLVTAVAFYPLGLIWWSPTTDLIWTAAGLVFSLAVLALDRKRTTR